MASRGGQRLYIQLFLFHLSVLSGRLALAMKEDHLLCRGFLAQMQYQKTSETLQKKKRKEKELDAYTISFSLSIYASVLLSCSSMCCSCLSRHTSSPDEFSCSSLLPVYVSFHASTPKRPFFFPIQVQVPFPIVLGRGICKLLRCLLSVCFIIPRRTLLELYQHQ